MNKEERRLDEFCKVGNLEDYRDVLQAIFSKIDQANCRISTREDGGRSIHEFPNQDGNCYTRIALKSFAENPIEAIWVILHEYGHHQSGTVEKSSFTKTVSLAREQQAWNIAREELLQYPTLACHIIEFDNYAHKCLKSYYEN
jgi:hypothetical protein